MRRALEQPRFAQLELTDGQIWGVPSTSSYDPFGLYERGVAPHLAFANSTDILKWHRDYGPLFGFTSAYSSTAEAFLGAQRRFVGILNLWQAWRGDRPDIAECFLVAVNKTGNVTLPGRGDVLGLNPGWDAEAGGRFEQALRGKTDSSNSRVTIDIGGKHPYVAADQFVREASTEQLRQAAERLLKYTLAVRLQGVQPDFHDQKGFEATWAVRDFLQACYLMLFFDVTKKRGIRNCKLCGQFFYPTTKRPRFCSKDCARKSRQRKYWKRRGKRVRRERKEEKKHDLQAR